MTLSSSSHEEDWRLGTLDQAVGAFGEAWASGDVERLQELLSPTYTHQDVYGRFQDCVAWLDYAKTRSGMATAISFHNIRRRIVGDVAIITGMNVIANAEDEKIDVDKGVRRIRFTQVWVWRKDRWLREAFQATQTTDQPDPE
jgi:hypothetical protein